MTQRTNAGRHSLSTSKPAPAGRAATATEGSAAGSAPGTYPKALKRLATAVSRWAPVPNPTLTAAERWQATRDALARYSEAKASARELRDERNGIAGDRGSLFDPAAQRHLDNTHQQSFTSEGSTRRQTARREAFALRAIARAVTHNPRIYRCGRSVIRKAGVAVVANDGGPARFDGVLSCGRVWLCPVCSSRIARLRAAELMHAIREHGATGGAIYFQTLTLAHSYGDDLGDLQAHVANAFRQLLQGKSWQLARQRFGIIGHVRALEATHGGAGWHPHLHVVWFAEAPLTRDARRQLQWHTFRTWRRAIVQLAGDQAAPRIGLCPLEIVRDDADAAMYVAKFGAALDDSRPALSAAMEVTSGRTKRARAGNRTPWEILADYGTRRRESDARLWHEWEQATHGKKALTWSRGLKARFGIIDLGDSALLRQESATATHQATVPRDEWIAIARRPSLQLRVLELVEAGGIDRLPAVWRRLRRWCGSGRRRVRWTPISEDTS